ncbi:hypothetical protein AB4Z30_18370 [Paenibacillus sp. 2TAF8]|jgi:hypothetical protein|uniref:hypothetical protein n=1 Tax=Paenibacillus sp. 2TAF8 TaxID=3233020 RepID=UPI003F94F9B6
MRKIVVNGSIYWWGYRTVRDLYCRSKLTIITENRDKKYIIIFVTRDTPISGSPLNEGLRMKKEGITYAVNLNQPKFIAEVLQCMLEMELDKSGKNVQEIDGNGLLSRMGYQDLTGLMI